VGVVVVELELDDDDDDDDAVGISIDAESLADVEKERNVFNFFLLDFDVDDDTVCVAGVAGEIDTGCVCIDECGLLDLCCVGS
jgi:hypothetical protein